MEKSYQNHRREYGNEPLGKSQADSDPYVQFDNWLNDILEKEHFDPTAMSLATVDENNQPNIRIVLLKDILDKQFIFYTNFDSQKGNEIKNNPKGALNFYWPALCRQIRILGKITKTDNNLSKTYFSSRPIDSQIAARISPQSKEIKNRDYLEDLFTIEKEKINDKSKIQKPNNWGGYGLLPHYFEFWQGRDNRLHDRLAYKKEGDDWVISRLAP